MNKIKFSMKKIIIIMALVIAIFITDFLVRLTGSNFIKFFKIASIVAIIPILFWNFILKFKKISIIILIILFFILFATLNKNDTTKKKQTEEVTKVTSEKESTEEKETTKEETSEEETTEEETTEEETTEEATEKKTTRKSGTGSSNTGNSEKNYEENASLQNLDGLKKAESSKKQKIGLGSGDSGASGSVETSNTGKSNASIERSTTSTSTEKKQEATTPAATEMSDGKVISPTNPYTDRWEEETTQPQTKKPDIVIDDPVPEPTTQQPTTKKQEETTKSTLVDLPTVVVPAEAYATVSYTKGAANCNVLVTFNKSTNATFKVCWYTKQTTFQSVKNSDGSYSLKVSVPSNYKGKLNVTIYDESGNEIGFYSKVVENLDY